MEPVGNKSRLTMTRVREALRYCPHERRAMVFEVSALIGVAILSLPLIGRALKAFGRGFAVVLQSFAPAINLDLGEGRPPPQHTFVAILAYAGPLTFVFCYVVSGFLAYQSDTLFPAEPVPEKAYPTVWFLTDWWNLALYLVVVPLYVSCAIFLIYVTAVSWKRINSIYAREVQATSFWSDSTRIVGFFAVSFILAGLYIAEYITDLANTDTTKTLYWFFHETGNGERTLNKAGYYYVFLNAVLLFITSMAAFCYIALSIEIMRFGKFVPQFVVSIERSSATDAVAREAVLSAAEARIQETLDEYAYAYIITKILVATYAVNIIVWQWSPAGEVANVNSAIIALAIIGLIFLVVPRLYLNSRWHRVKFEMLKASGKIEDSSIGEELKPRRFRRVETLLDAVFLFLLFKAAEDQADKWGRGLDSILDAIGAIFA